MREKTKQTNLIKYGVEYPSQSKKIREKSKQTCLKRYGIEYPLQSEEIKEMLNLIYFIYDEEGVPYTREEL